ncbi:large conductance mechanosensitive channel protein MscL [Guptibacillus algicola]|uniref:large conductance mechanosensitive channel protein MscL n=1 Tax=Guptibacillus algicola TaxID=225844 RepID=UPI001CD5A0BF|nr:large conductance mechanosensitive channel protein MscL [Alkalihalobacillus algicola]MCA0989515.1 large conductance mechanosensitive channel protein MscL [Alkalihalobacillus algicola]
MGLLHEFRQFAIRGSAADMGIGMVLGAAFSTFIDSLVTDIILPPIGLLLARINFSELYISLNGHYYSSLSEAREAGAATINYGVFLSTAIRFMIIFFAVFLVVRQLNRWRRPGQDPINAMTRKECPLCCTAIPSKAIICPNCASSLREEGTKEQSQFRPKVSFRR